MFIARRTLTDARHTFCLSAGPSLARHTQSRCTRAPCSTHPSRRRAQSPAWVWGGSVDTAHTPPLRIAIWHRIASRVCSACCQGRAGPNHTTRNDARCIACCKGGVRDGNPAGRTLGQGAPRLAMPYALLCSASPLSKKRECTGENVTTSFIQRRITRARRATLSPCDGSRRIRARTAPT